jgi:hypothetical protein
MRFALGQSDWDFFERHLQALTIYHIFLPENRVFVLFCAAEDVDCSQRAW